MKNLVKKLMFMSFGILLTPFSYSAVEFVPGYVIDNHGDTIHGQLKFENWDINPDKISFRLKKSSRSVFYKPMTIKEFGVQDQNFISAIVQKEISPNRDEDLQKDPTLHLALDTVFLKVLFKGEKCLYYLQESDEKEHFYIQQDSTIQLLLHKTYVEYNPTRKTYENKRYLAQLTPYLMDYPAILEDVVNTSYEKASLVALFSKYNALSGKMITHKMEKKNSTSNFGLVAGISSTIALIESNSIIAGYGPSTNFTGGISFDLPISGKHRDFSFYNEFMFSSFKIMVSGMNYYSRHRVAFDFQYLKLNSLVRFRPSWFFFNLGISNGYSIRSRSNIFYDMRKYEIGALLGAGIKYKNYSLEYRYEIGDGMSPYIETISEVYRSQVLLGYSF